MSLTAVDDALAQILDEIESTPEVEFIGLTDLLGRVLAQDVVSKINVPPVDNSAMDGYALCSSDVGEALTLPISQRILAGTVAEPLQSGSAARIFTGAEIPQGADIVVMQENCTVEAGKVKISQSGAGDIRVGQNIRRQGQDITPSQVILTKGRRLRPQDVALIASIGLAKCAVYKTLTVAVLSTGDELLEPGDEHGHGKIYNSNRYSMMAMLQAFGFNVLDGGTIGDSVEHSASALKCLAQKADVLISSGGVSVGEADFVKDALQKVGRQSLWRLAMKPGKPLVYGHVGDTAFFGLPGNPAAVFATFCVIVRPYLLRLQGQLQGVQVPVVSARADFDFLKAGTRQEYLRAFVSNDCGNGQLQASIHGNQSSGILSSASWANAFVVMPIGKTVAKGELVEVLLFDSLLN